MKALKRIWRIIAGMLACFYAPGAPAAPADILQVNADCQLQTADGEHVRLIGIRMARNDAWRPAVCNTLRETLASGTPSLTYETHRRDRYERILVHITIKRKKTTEEEEISLAETLLRAGLAYVTVSARNLERIPAYLALERKARRAGHGIWGNPEPEIPVLTPSGIKTQRYHNRFVILNGQVQRVARREQAVFINFSRTWWKDVTVRIPKTVWDTFTDAKVPLDATMEGRRIEVRGWLFPSRYGGEITVLRPEFLEILPPKIPETSSQASGFGLPDSDSALVCVS